MGHRGYSTFGSLGQPLSDAVSPSSCVGGRGSCTAGSGSAGWSLPSWGLFHPKDPPLCLHLLRSASGAGWNSCLCPLLCVASREVSRVCGASLGRDIARGTCCRRGGEQEVSWELLLPFPGESCLGCPGSRTGTLCPEGDPALLPHTAPWQCWGWVWSPPGPLACPSEAFLSLGASSLLLGGRAGLAWPEGAVLLPS